MANFIMEIQGQTTLTFEITPKFFPRLALTWKRDGKEVAAQDSVPVHGWFSDDDPDLDTKIRQLHDLAQNGAPMVFIFKTDTGDERYRFERGHIFDLEEVDSDGSRVNHVEFRFTIREERGVTFPNLVDVNHEDIETQTVDADGGIRNIFRRTVSATGEFGNTVPARAFVESLIPNFANLTRKEIRTVFFDGVVTGTFEFDLSAEEANRGGVRRWRETAKRRPGVENVAWFRTAGAPFPIRGGTGQSSVQVTGRIEVYDPNSITPVSELVDFIKNQITADTGPFLIEPEFGAANPIEFAADDPALVTVFDFEYSFTLEFGETPPSVLGPAPDTRQGLTFAAENVPAGSPGGGGGLIQVSSDFSGIGGGGAAVLPPQG